MRKLTFERAVLIVFILIILISTSDITTKYYYKHFDKYFGNKSVYNVNNASERVAGMPSVLMKANELFKAGNYEAAADEYLAIAINNTPNLEQKSQAYFNLGVCQYYLKNYDLALDSFERVIGINPTDSLAYNNAAVSAFRSNDLIKAIQMQEKALGLRPAVEYYYNLARMYEDNEQYDMAADNYLQVAIGEGNISEIERIDPVRVKERVARLLSSNESSTSEVGNRFLIAYKLYDTRDVFLVNENEMEIKQSDFLVKVENQNASKNIVAEYDKIKNDPYNLISQLVWTIYKDGKQLYKKNGEKITALAKTAGNYEVRLSIKYNGNKEVISTRNVNIKENQSSIDIGTADEIVVSPIIDAATKAYPYAVYEQLFESDFKINNNGYTDKYSVVWGTDSGVEAILNKRLAVDKSASLVLKNASSNDAGLWINLDSLLKDDKIKGKSVSINFYGREISDSSKLYIDIRIKSDSMISITPVEVKLPLQFERKTIRVFVPVDAKGFTISIKTSSGGEFNIDAFTIVD